MSFHLKPIDQQVICITGADSPQGEAIVREALSQGARVFMTGTDEPKLQALQDEMRRRDLPTAYALANKDVAQLQLACDHCLSTYGTIDTWINCEDHYWSALNGSRVAVGLLKGSGGSIINMGKKVKNYTEGLRRHLLREKAPIRVSLVIPSFKTQLVARSVLKCAVRSQREVIVRRSNVLAAFRRLFKSESLLN